MAAQDKPIDAAKPKARRPLTFVEMQPYMFGYGFCISIFSPYLTAWQLTKVYKKNVPTPRLMNLSARILPQQTFLKMAQMNACTPVKEYLNPWAAFFCVGVLQGGVYGHCNVYMSKVLELSKGASYAGMFRGVMFAGTRDSISQGVPFMFGTTTEKYVFDPLWSAVGLQKARGEPSKVKRMTSVLSTSVVATFMSQGLHNCQIRMQADQQLTYASTVSTLWKEHGAHIFYRGGSARVGLLLIVNGLNELLLKPAWAGVEVDE